MMTTMTMLPNCFHCPSFEKRKTKDATHYCFAKMSARNCRRRYCYPRYSADCYHAKRSSTERSIADWKTWKVSIAVHCCRCYCYCCYYCYCYRRCSGPPSASLKMVPDSKYFEKTSLIRRCPHHPDHYYYWNYHHRYLSPDRCQNHCSLQQLQLSDHCHLHHHHLGSVQVRHRLYRRQKLHLLQHRRDPAI